MKYLTCLNGLYRSEVYKSGVHERNNSPTHNCRKTRRKTEIEKGSAATGCVGKYQLQKWKEEAAIQKYKIQKSVSLLSVNTQANSLYKTLFKKCARFFTEVRQRKEIKERSTEVWVHKVFKQQNIKISDQRRSLACKAKRAIMT